jgi:hypothetical protein
MKTHVKNRPAELRIASARQSRRLVQHGDDDRPDDLARAAGVSRKRSGRAPPRGCIAGAAPVERIESWLAQAGFIDIRVTPRPESRELVASWAPGRGIENFVASATVEARKPARDGASRG